MAKRRNSGSSQSISAIPANREPSTKKVFKRKAKSFVEGVAKSCFGRTYKSTIVRSRPRKAELAYKIKLLGKASSEGISRFNKEVVKRALHHYTLAFSGKINPRTGKEEVFLDLVLFGDITMQACEDTKILTFLKKHIDRPAHHKEDSYDEAED